MNYLAATFLGVDFTGLGGTNLLAIRLFIFRCIMVGERRLHEDDHELCHDIFRTHMPEMAAAETTDISPNLAYRFHAHSWGRVDSGRT
jgi:hypothetical protein